MSLCDKLCVYTCVLFTCMCCGIDAQPHHWLDLELQQPHICQAAKSSSCPADIARKDVSDVSVGGDEKALGCQHHFYTAVLFLEIWAGRENKTVHWKRCAVRIQAAEEAIALSSFAG